MILPIVATVASLLSSPAPSHVQLLRVKVLEGLETPADLTWSEEDRISSRGTERWPATPHLVVLPKRTGPQNAHLERVALLPERTSDGTFDYALQQGKEYWVGVYGGGVAFRPQVVRVRRGHRVESITLQIDRDPMVSVNLLACNEPPFDSLMFALYADLLTVEDAATGVVLIRGTRENLMAGFQLPASHYRVHIDDCMDYPRCGSPAGVVRRRMGRMTREIRLESNRPISLRVEVPPGGNLDLELLGTWRHEDLIGAERIVPRDEAASEMRLETAAVFLVPDRGARIPVRFATMDSGVHEGSPVALAVHSVLPLNSRQTSEVLPAGEFTLLATLPGGRFCTAAVTVREGGVTRCQLRF